MVTLERAYKYLNVSATADGDNVVVAAPGPGKAIQIMNYTLRAVGTGDAVLRSGLAGAISLTMAGAVAPGLVYSASGGSPEVGVIQLIENTSLNINNAASEDTLGHLVYRIVQTNVT